MSDEPVWISRQALLLKHAELLRLFGGPEGIRDETLLDFALGRPLNAFANGGERRIPYLAAAYAFGLAKNHPFIDGNKRAAFMACVAFLKLNGFDLRASQPEAYRAMIALASGQMSEADFGAWIEQHAAPRDRP